MRKSSIHLPLLAVMLFGCGILTTPSTVVQPSTDTAPANILPPVRITPTTEPAIFPGGWPDAYAMNARIGRAVNFGNALEAPAEGDWGVVLHEEYFQNVADAGFNAIRLAVRWNTHALEESPYTIHPSFFNRVDWAVDNALSRGLVLILDFHHFTDYMDCAACERTRLLMFWEQIAEHYRGYPPELVFEVLNEPTDEVAAGEWNATLASALGVIRASNSERTVIAGPVDWNGLWSLQTLELPEDDRNLIVTFHYYSPFEFTHQGAEWAEGSEAWLGTQWTGSPAEENAVRGDFQFAAEWGSVHHRPVFLGEFGAYEKADMPSRARWTAFTAREAEALSFSWAYWEFCAGFGVFDSLAHGWREPLLRALLPNSPLLEG